MSKPEDTGLPAEASRLRQEIARRATEMHGLLDTLLGGGTLFRGQVYDAKVRCGKPTCHCLLTAIGSFAGHVRGGCDSIREGGRTSAQRARASANDRGRSCNAAEGQAEGLATDEHR